MNYFEFFDLEPAFFIDETVLKSKFYANSKKYHPDFYTMESAEKQNEVMQLAVTNNKAYKILNNFESRLKYILDIEESLGEEGSNKLPQSFLMEMMDFNEKIMELQFDFDRSTYEECQKELKDLKVKFLEEAQVDIDAYRYKNTSPESLENIKLFYLKNRYLLRIQESLLKFADA
jgi:molecular chaperone HscB